MPIEPADRVTSIAWLRTTAASSLPPWPLASKPTASIKLSTFALQVIGERLPNSPRMRPRRASLPSTHRLACELGLDLRHRALPELIPPAPWPHWVPPGGAIVNAARRARASVRTAHPSASQGTARPSTSAPYVFNRGLILRRQRQKWRRLR